MPSYRHEALVELVRDRPVVAAEFLAGPLGVPVPTFQQAHLASTGLARISPELTVLSLLAHGAGLGQEDAFESYVAAMKVIDKNRANLYTDVAYDTLRPAARHLLEAWMTTTTHRYHSEFARRYYDQGEAQGEARAVLTFLDARGIEVPDDVRETIVACTDLEQLDLWVRRATTADKVQDLFA